MPAANGVALVGSSWSLGVRATRFVLRWVVFGIATYWLHWWRLLKADNLTDPGMIRRRRAWLLVWTPSTLLLFGVILPGVGPFLVRTVGLFPLLVVPVAAAVSTVAMRRQGRRARGAVPAATHANPAVDLGEWSDVHPRTQAAERAIGDLLWRLSENGWSPADAMGVVASMPPFSQTVVLWCCESNLARFSDLGAEGKLDGLDAMGPMLWFFDFTAKLRAWLGGGPTLAVAEPAMRRGR